MFNNFDGTTKAAIGHQPQLLSGSSAVNGETIDKQAIGYYKDCKFYFFTGQKGGEAEATSFTATCKVQHSDNGTDWTDLTDDQIVSADSVVLNAEADVDSISVYLHGTKRYIRGVGTPAFTGGTSPNVQFGSLAVFGEPRLV